VQSCWCGETSEDKFGFVNNTNSPVIIYYYNTRVAHHVAIEVQILLWKLANAPLAFDAGIQMTHIFSGKSTPSMAL